MESQIVYAGGGGVNGYSTRVRDRVEYSKSACYFLLMRYSVSHQDVT
jgi:hypothetical protein